MGDGNKSDLLSSLIKDQIVFTVINILNTQRSLTGVPFQNNQFENEEIIIMKMMMVVVVVVVVVIR